MHFCQRCGTSLGSNLIAIVLRRYCAMVVDGTEGDDTLPCWRTLLAMQRVSAGVAKALLLCVVTANPTRAESEATLSLPTDDTDATAAVIPKQPSDGYVDGLGRVNGALQASRLQVEVMEVSRWAPELNRRA